MGINDGGERRREDLAAVVTQDCASDDGVKLAMSVAGVDVAWNESKTPATPKGERSGVTATLVRSCFLWPKKVICESEQA